MITMMDYNRYFNMNTKSLVAYYIWQIREEIGMDGNAEYDWWLAEKFINDFAKNSFEYEDVYTWVMENA